MNSRTTALVLLASSLALGVVPQDLRSDDPAKNLKRAMQHFRHAEKLSTQGDLDEAITEYEKAIQLKADDPWWHVRFAMTLEDKASFSAAREQFRIASQLDPSNPTLRLFAGGHMGKLLAVTSCADGAGKQMESGEEVLSVGGEVAPPVPTFKPTAPYSEQARKAKYQGTVVLAAVITQKATSFLSVYSSLSAWVWMKGLLRLLACGSLSPAYARAFRCQRESRSKPLSNSFRSTHAERGKPRIWRKDRWWSAHCLICMHPFLEWGETA